MLSSVIWFFLRSPVGRALGVVLALCAWTTYQRIDAAADAKASCQQDHFEALVAEKERQLAVVQEIAQDARERADRAESEMLELREAADAITSELGGSCDIPDDIRQRLRDIK
jgi:type II secretory pathway component PulM